MRKRKAIKMIQSQINKIEKLDNPVRFDNSWLVQTRSYIKEIFGPKSNEYLWIARLYTGCSYSKNPLPHLYNCIETIKNKGAYKAPRNNFLALLPDWAAGFLLTIIFSIGVAIGESKVVSNAIYKDNLDNYSMSVDSISASFFDSTKIHTNSQSEPKHKDNN